MSKVGSNGVILFVISALICISAISCRKDLEFETNSTNLRFSKDTVFLDTIFTQSNSETYLLKVYNDSDNDVSLRYIYLNQRSNSAFRINLDGRSGYEFSEIPLRANDSLMVFVEVAVQNGNQDMIEEDEIFFADTQQQVKLLAMTEDAIYHYPAQGEDFVYLNDDTTWANVASHVIYGNLKLVENKSLTIQEGTKIYLSNNSSIITEPNATLNLNGTIENPILIRGARHDARYDTLPKQWNQIKIREGNLNAQNVILKGGTKGFNLENAIANIHNTQIYNMASSGIFAINSNVTGTNVAISDAGEACLNIEKGGNYSFYYSTFANNWETGVVGISGPYIPAYLSNYTATYDDEGNEIGEEYAMLDAFFGSCIFYGAYPNGAYLDAKDDAGFAFDIQNCLIKNENTSEFDFSSFNPITENPLFQSTIFSQQDLRLQEDSPARNQANNQFNSFAPNDIKGIQRGANPNLGAYE